MLYSAFHANFEVPRACCVIPQNLFFQSHKKAAFFHLCGRAGAIFSRLFNTAPAHKPACTKMKSLILCRRAFCGMAAFSHRPRFTSPFDNENLKHCQGRLF